MDKMCQKSQDEIDITLEPKKVRGKKDLEDAVESEEEVMVEL